MIDELNETVAVTSRSFSRHPLLRRELLQRFPTVRFNEEGLALNGEALVGFLKGCKRAILALEKVDETLLRQLPDLKIISKVGVGLDNFDLNAMRERGVALAWQPGTNSRSVAELVVGLTLNLMRSVLAQNSEVRAGKWRQVKGRCLSGSTVGIVGCGHIGKELVHLLSGFGCRILVCDPAGDTTFFRMHQVEPVQLSELLQQSDVVTLHLPRNNETHHLINEARLNEMRQGSILINTARGGLIDEAAAASALKSGKLGGIGLDAYEVEPVTESPLLGLDHVVMTPHTGAHTNEAIAGMGIMAAQNLIAVLSGNDCKYKIV